MTFINWIELILSILLGLGGLAAGLGYAYGQFRDGHNKEKIDSISILESDVKNLRNEVEKLRGEVQKLTEENHSKEKKIQEFMDIFNGRNPMMDTFVKQGGEFMTTYGVVLTKLDKYLDKQTF